MYAQLGQQPLARTTETSEERSSGLLSCLSARPPDLADAARTRPRVVAMFLSMPLARLYTPSARRGRALGVYKRDSAQEHGDHPWRVRAALARSGGRALKQERRPELRCSDVSVVRT